MRKYLATMLLAFGLAGTAMADADPAQTTSTTTTTAPTPAPAPAPSPNAQKWQELTGSALPPIGPLVAAQQTGDALQQASLSSKAKTAAKQGLDDLMKQADMKLTPVLEVLDHAVSVKKRNESQQDDVIRRMQEHEQSRPGPNASEGEVNQFNAGVDQLNKELESVHEQIRTDNESFDKQFSAAVNDYEAWVTAHAGDYVAAGQKLLSGEFKEGEAMRQLKKAATGVEPAADVFDGGGGWSDPNVVDLSDIPHPVPKDLKKSPKNVRKTATPPPPTPPTPPTPSTSSDTAKSKPAKRSR